MSKLHYTKGVEAENLGPEVQISFQICLYSPYVNLCVDLK